MGTYILLNNEKTREYAIFDYKPGEFDNNWYAFRDRDIVHNENGQLKYYDHDYGDRITVPEWVAKHGLPSCLQGVYDNDWIPF